MEYDALSRPTFVEEDDGEIRETVYDGLSRSTLAVDDNGGSPHRCEFVYDSLSRVLEEQQNGRAISSVWNGGGKRVQCTYPGGPDPRAELRRH